MYFLKKIVNNNSMLKKSIRFIDENNLEQVFVGNVNIINKNISPFKEIIKNGDYFSYSAIFNDLEEYKFSFEEAFNFLVNVQEVGSFYFLFNNKFFNKGDVFKKVSALKEIENSKEKVDLLFSSLRDCNILFAIYIPKGNNYLVATDLEKYSENIFYLEKKIEEIKEEEPKLEVKPKEKSNRKSFFSTLIDPFIEDKFKFLFISVASLIISVAAVMAIYYCYTGKAVYYVFFAFSLVGAAFNFIIFKDYQKQKRMRWNDMTLCGISSIIGYLLGVAFYFIFLSVAKEIPESLTDVNKPVLYALAIFGGLELISVVASVIFTLLTKKKSN